MASARQLLSTLVSIASTRLELLANEWQEERLRLSQMLLLALLALFCFGVGALLLTLFIVLLFWDEHRLVVTAVMSVLFITAGTLIGALLHRMLQEKSRLFSVSLAELAKDREHLDADRE
ncbi:MAG: phage holin family protein [Nitrosomonadales bacterium]|nr:phage holin family protein [Nitrosomonadales bacterium]